MNTKNNQRFQETEQKILEIFSELLSEKEVSQITVREICEKAGINRSSFYLHFQDVYDLLEKLEYFTMLKSGQIFSDPSGDYHLQDRFVRFFDFIQDHQDFFKAYLNDQHEMHILNGVLGPSASSKYHEVIHELGYESGRELAYHNAFFQAGLTAMVREWLNAGCPETTKELGEILLREYHPAKFKTFD